MIAVLPMEDKEREKSLLDGISAAGSEARILLMTDRGDEAGWAAVELVDGTLRILKLFAKGYDAARKPESEELFTLDTLLRAAASYGESFGASSLEAAFPDFYGFFKARGFDTEGDFPCAPMSAIVRYE